MSIPEDENPPCPCLPPSDSYSGLPWLSHPPRQAPSKTRRAPASPSPPSSPLASSPLLPLPLTFLPFPSPQQAGLKAIDEFRANLADKGKSKANERAGSLRGMKALCDKFGAAAESAVLPMLGPILEALADKLRPVSVEAEALYEAILASLSPHAVLGITPTILEERDGKWQSNLGRAKMLQAFGSKFPVQTNRVLTTVIPVVSGLMWDTKPQVKDAASEAINTITATCTNKDIVPSIPDIIACILKPELTNECVHKLAGCVFVQDIDGSALAIMCPLLKRGLDENVTATKRNVARIIENMAKLVDDPYEVEPFVPQLLPQLKRAKDEVSDPEARNVCEKAHDQLVMTQTQVKASTSFIIN